ncbi:hypothetical protein Pst134EA_027719 [Puccinia striiformis f. sp. tritici]|uniref:hypothetical protein n=1 Tax=Puccinia striiformis f. sp. tritici TaxID=168172 RepID=UPI0020077F85|nr:hypothetical protein Pst134EA_027719 [Puccinia striiformis f. sp. tritici]KAH9448408.1 hypothetical protein Pst134EA_027719 [Puccinia striiformis f. sp. tritici]
MRPRVDLPLLSTGRGRLLSVKPGCRVRASWLLTNPHHIQTSYKSHRLPLNTRATEVRSIVSDSQLLCQDQHWRNPERHSKDDWNSDPTPISGLFYPHCVNYPLGQTCPTRARTALSELLSDIAVRRVIEPIRRTFLFEQKSDFPVRRVLEQARSTTHRTCLTELQSDKADRAFLGLGARTTLSEGTSDDSVRQVPTGRTCKSDQLANRTDRSDRFTGRTSLSDGCESDKSNSSDISAR